jgi:hypothetical protein
MSVEILEQHKVFEIEAERGQSGNVEVVCGWVTQRALGL